MADTTEMRAICASATLPDTDGTGGAPEWVELLPVGNIKGRDGRSFQLADPQDVVAASLTANAELPIDYEHQADDPDRRANGPVPAAGWISALEVRDGSLWGRVKWTERAAEMIGAREYRYLSPVLLHRRDGTVLRLLGASLVHRPNLELKALASDGAGMPETDLAPRRKGRDDTVILQEIAALLGLDPETASYLEIIDAVKGLAEPDPQRYMPVEAVQSLLREHKENLQAVNAERVERRVDEAVINGYITPAMREWATALCSRDPESFGAFLAASTPAYAYLFERQAKRIASAAGLPPMTGDAEQIARNLGIDPSRLAE